MRAFLIILLVAIGCVYCYAQEKKAKSYKTFSQEKSIDELLQEASILKDNNPKEALNNVEKALAISLSQNNIFNEGRCYVMLGEINENIEEWKLALENFKNAYQKLHSSYKDTKEYLHTLRGLGTSFLKLKNYPQALEYFQEALSLKLTPTERIEQQLDISDVYFQMGDYKQALAVLENIDNSKIPDQSLNIKVQNQKAKIYARTNEVDKAAGIYQSSQNKLRSKVAIPKEEEKSMTSAKEEIADVLREQKRYDDEIELRNQSIDFNLNANNLKEVSKDKVELGKVLDSKGETAAAIKELEEAAHIADTINNPKEQARAFLTLADLYEKKGSATNALFAYRRYSEAVLRAEMKSDSQLIQKSELIKKQRDIEELSKNVAIDQRDETIARAIVVRQQFIIYGLLGLLLIIIITSYFIYKNAQASKIANQLLALKSLRSQMNPHFIFNALNSINHFVAQNDERAVNKFLSEFSRLMRLVLENSQEDFIPLYKEQEIISLYLKLEHYRFRDKFDYSIYIDENINTESIQLPPMLLQPYIENAVWHGLRYKDNKGQLTVTIKKEADKLVAKITDDGIGRKRSSELKTENQKKHNSTGLKNIRERLAIINKVYKINYSVSIEDLSPEKGEGTRVVINLPLHKINGHESSDHRR